MNVVKGFLCQNVLIKSINMLLKCQWETVSAFDKCYLELNNTERHFILISLKIQIFQKWNLQIDQIDSSLCPNCMFWVCALSSLTSSSQNTTRWKTSATPAAAWPWSPGRASRRAQDTLCSAGRPSQCWPALLEDKPSDRDDQTFRKKLFVPDETRERSEKLMFFFNL